MIPHLELVILIGPPGSGKSTYCAQELGSHFRVSQDDQGKEGHLKIFIAAISRKEPKIVIDRMNHLRYQRERYAKPALEAGYSVKYVRLQADYDLCLSRIAKRENHPTIKDEATARKALDLFFREVDDFHFKNRR